MADLYIAFYTSRAARKLAYSALKILTLATGRQALSVTGACRLDCWPITGPAVRPYDRASVGVRHCYRRSAGGRMLAGCPWHARHPRGKPSERRRLIWAGPAGQDTAPRDSGHPDVGGGFGGLVLPSGAYDVKGDQVRWVPAVDATIVVLASLSLVRVLARTWARRRRRPSRR